MVDWSTCSPFTLLFGGQIDYPHAPPSLYYSVDKSITPMLYTVLDHFPIHPKKESEDLPPPPIEIAKAKKALSFTLSFPHSSLLLNQFLKVFITSSLLNSA